MAINESQKLSRLARHSQVQFLSRGSLLNHTRLNRFILIAFLLHASVIILQSLIITKSENSLAPPPIKVKYVHTQKPESLKNKELLVKAQESKKVVEQKTKLPIQKKYRQKKTVNPQVQVKPNILQRTKTQAKFKKAPNRQPKQRAIKKKKSLPLSHKETIIKDTNKSNIPPVSLEKLDPQGGVLSMLDGFDVEKYAMQNTRTRTAEGSDDEEPISLDTKEAKYVSYFSRIKHQIQRVWTYPSQAAQRGVNGQLTLKFQISRDGNLLSVRLINKSGFEILDIAAIKAVKEAAPYYPFPITISKKKLSILATFIYSPNLNYSNAQ